MHKVPFNPTHIYKKAMTIVGYEVIEDTFPTDDGLCHTTAVILSIEDIIGEYEAYGDSFGSTDETFVIKSFVDNMLIYSELNNKYKTTFSPFLRVVEKIEDHKRIIAKTRFCLN